MNKVELLKSLDSLLTEPVVLQVPTFLNESRASVAHGLDLALSNLMGAIEHHARTPAGIDSLLRVLRSPDIDSDLLTRDLMGMFSGGDETHNLIDIGKAKLALLFGPRVHEFNNALAGISSLTPKSAALLTGMVTPFVLAAVKHLATATGPLEASVVGTVLDAQSPTLRGRISEKLLSALGFGGIASWIGTEGSRVRDEAHVVGARVHQTATTAGRDVAMGKRKWMWLALLLLALLLLLLLGFCVKSTPDTTEQPDAAASASSIASAATGVAQDAASAVSNVIPKGAGVIAAMMSGKPELKIYFDYGQAELSSDFADKAKDVLSYLKDHPSSKASVSGFTDSSGDQTLNAALAKKRAESVKAALLAAGVDASRISLDKPNEVSGSTPDAKDRRVEVHVQ